MSALRPEVDFEQIEQWAKWAAARRPNLLNEGWHEGKGSVELFGQTVLNIVNYVKELEALLEDVEYGVDER